MNREAVDALLDSIDGALCDYELSPDAMRWVPEDDREERPPEPPGSSEPFWRSMADAARLDAYMRRAAGIIATSAGAFEGLGRAAQRASASADEYWSRDTITFRMTFDITRYRTAFQPVLQKLGRRLSESRADSARRRHIIHQMRIMSRRAARRRSRG